MGGIDPTLYKTSSGGAADDDDDDDDGLDQVDGGRSLGSVRFGVAYERETERLTVTLVRCRNLPSRNPGTANACDPFVRLLIVVVINIITITIASRFEEKGNLYIGSGS